MDSENLININLKKKILNLINSINTLKKLTKITKLVISSGGMRGLSYIGAIKYLDEINILNNINEFYGCSAGGLISALLLIGYTIDELMTFTINFNFMMLINLKLDTLINNYSFIESNTYIDLLKELIKKKNPNPNITLIELFNKTNKKLTLVGYNISQQIEVIFDHISHPDVPLWQICYITSAIPGIFPPILYGDDYYCDGGVTNGNPINLIPDNMQKYTLCISSDYYKIDKCRINEMLKNKNIINYFKFTSEFLSLMIDKENYKINKYNNIIRIPYDKSFDFINLNIKKNERYDKMMFGYNHCKNNLQNILSDILKIDKSLINNI